MTGSRSLESHQSRQEQEGEGLWDIASQEKKKEKVEWIDYLIYLIRYIGGENLYYAYERIDI